MVNNKIFSLTFKALRRPDPKKYEDLKLWSFGILTLLKEFQTTVIKWEKDLKFEAPSQNTAESPTCLTASVPIGPRTQLLLFQMVQELSPKSRADC